MKHTASVELSTRKPSVENGIRAPVMAATSQSSQRPSMPDSLSAMRPTTISPTIPVRPLAMPYCRPTSPSVIPRARIRNAGAKVVRA